MKVNINGPSSPYKFIYNIYDPRSYLETTNEITQLDVRINDIQAPIYGGGIETAEIWFYDSTVLKDLAGNNFNEGKIIGNLNIYEYISEENKQSAESSGSSMKYTLLSMFSINLLLKLVISSSAALMWSLIHVLQVFRYILMININMPIMTDILMQYLAVVVGEVDEIEELMPDLVGSYLIKEEDLTYNVTLYTKFEENGYDTPFLALLFSRQMSIILISTLISIPFILVGIKFLKKIPFIYKKLMEIWTGFFFNTPLRTFTELFIEISLGFFLNTLNIQFMNTSGIIATSLMFAVGMIVYIIKFRPLKSELQQVICASDEFTIIFGMIVLYFLFYRQDDPIASYRLGLIIIGIIVASMLKNLSVIFFISIKSSYIKFRTWVHKKINHTERRKQRLKEEAINRAEKEAKLKREEELLRNRHNPVKSIKASETPVSSPSHEPVFKKSHRMNSLMSSLKKIDTKAPNLAVESNSTKLMKEDLPEADCSPATRKFKNRRRFKSNRTKRTKWELKDINNIEPIEEDDNE